MIATLSLDRPFPSATILVPPVRLNGGRLCFQAEGPLELTVGQSGRLVFDFANLAEAREQAFLDFAKVWGVLGICPHGESIHHRSPPCLPRRIGTEYIESITQWRRLAHYVRALLNIRVALNRGEPGDAADWRRIWPRSPPTQRVQGAEILAVVASVFLSTAQVLPMLESAEGRLSVTFVGGDLVDLLKAMSAHPRIGRWLSSSGNLRAELAMRTILALQNGPGWSVCSDPDCRQLYRPSRAPALGRHNFCPSCGKRASWRRSKRDSK